MFHTPLVFMLATTCHATGAVKDGERLLAEACTYRTEYVNGWSIGSTMNPVCLYCIPFLYSCIVMFYELGFLMRFIYSRSSQGTPTCTRHMR
jgi:hypothetical protein